MRRIFLQIALAQRDLPVTQFEFDSRRMQMGDTCGKSSVFVSSFTSQSYCMAQCVLRPCCIREMEGRNRQTKQADIPEPQRARSPKKAQTVTLSDSTMIQQWPLQTGQILPADS
ncbi:hypothetical protein U9M48_021001 [Paspalum notatum var. saurae]|uniref:Uncharacterized protein n=1 Tax=Paspalum notatum var. saurae TaxID=547442 RepID=A0AAQ3WT31_PASNO